MSTRPVKKFKNILDYIHGMMQYDSFLFNFIDTPEFQRLRDIKQLSTTQYIFPSANHSRLEHSFGVCFLANKFVNHLQYNQPECEITKRTARTITLAGLCANLGHAPFSSSFSDFYQEKYNITWNQHEYAVKLFNRIIDNNNIDDTKEGCEFDTALIRNIIGRNADTKAHWTGQIVNNTLNGIDVNIFDSLLRDSYKFGFSNQSYDYQILMNNARIINDTICYRIHDAFPVFELFSSQHSMALKFYSHRVTNCIDLMIKDIFLESDAYMQYTSKLDDMDKYIDFTDNILNEILHSKASQLSTAKKLIERINKRDFYSYVGQYESTTSKNTYDDCFNTFDVNTLLKHTSNDNATLAPEEIRIVKMKMNLGIGPGDPFESITFYDNNHQIMKTKAGNISQLLPNKFQEKHIIRICVTSNDEKKKEAAQNALTNFCKEKGKIPTLFKSNKKPEQFRNDLYLKDYTGKALFTDDNE